MKHALLLAAATILTLHSQGVLASSQDDQSSRDEVCEQLHRTGAWTGYVAYSGFFTGISGPVWRGVLWAAEDGGSNMWMPDPIRDNRAALTQQEIDLMRASDSPRKIIKSAQKRYAHAHGVPHTVASIFSNKMSKKDDLRRALSACAGDYLSDRSLPESDFPAYNASELTDFLNALHHIGRERWSCDKYEETIRQKRLFLYDQVKEGRSLDEAADLLFQDTMRHPNEEVRAFDAAQFAHLPRSVRLRASLLKQDWPLKMEILTWLAGQEEDRALASLALLTSASSQDATRYFMQAAPTFDVPYLRRFVKIWYNLPPTCELMTVLQMGALPRQDLKVIRGAADRRALLGSRGLLKPSLVVRLLRVL